jgi:hypothetical protein
MIVVAIAARVAVAQVSIVRVARSRTGEDALVPKFKDVSAGKCEHENCDVNARIKRRELGWQELHSWERCGALPRIEKPPRRGNGEAVIDSAIGQEIGSGNRPDLTHSVNVSMESARLVQVPRS